MKAGYGTVHEEGETQPLANSEIPKTGGSLITKKRLVAFASGLLIVVLMGLVSQSSFGLSKQSMAAQLLDSDRQCIPNNSGFGCQTDRECCSGFCADWPGPQRVCEDPPSGYRRPIHSSFGCWSHDECLSRCCGGNAKIDPTQPNTCEPLSSCMSCTEAGDDYCSNGWCEDRYPNEAPYNVKPCCSNEVPTLTDGRWICPACEPQKCGPWP